MFQLSGVQCSPKQARRNEPLESFRVGNAEMSP